MRGEVVRAAGMVVARGQRPGGAWKIGRRIGGIVGQVIASRGRGKSGGRKEKGSEEGRVWEKRARLCRPGNQTPLSRGRGRVAFFRFSRCYYPREEIETLVLGNRGAVVGGN